MADVIAVLNQKGGAGKSTLATNLARAYQLGGRKVLVADADPQATAIEWSESYTGENEMPVVVGVDKDRFGSDVEAISPAFDVVIIDGAPRMGARNRTAVRVADLVLIPVQPSAFDIRATRPLVEMIREQREYTPDLPLAAFVVSRGVTGSNLANEASHALQAFGLPVLSASTAQRVAYPEAAGLGVSVLDYEPSGKAADEIRALAHETMQLLHGEEEA